MSDSRRRFRVIRKALHKLYLNQAQGNLARHLDTLAAIISGIVGSRSSQLPQIAGKVPDGNKVESREKRFSRWVNNEKIERELYFLPFAEALLQSLALQTLVLAIDGSVVGRDCIALMVNVIYKGRALPIAWTVVRGKKGHLPEDVHIDLVQQVKRLVPDEAYVVFVGDGEFDGIDLQKTVEDSRWKYVCATGANIKIFWESYEFSCGHLSSHFNPGEQIGLPGVLFTREKYGPVMLICWWRKDCKEPIYLVTNMESVEEACQFYSKRFRIETFFSDQKSRGFHLHKSHISDPERLSRLLTAACLAYIWIVYLGVLCIKDGWIKIIHRTHRCDLSLFQLGLRLLDYFLNEGRRIPVAFNLL